jgi:hypothetical protein
MRTDRNKGCTLRKGLFHPYRWKNIKILTCTVLVDVLVSMAPYNVSRGADYVEYKI